MGFRGRETKVLSLFLIFLMVSVVLTPLGAYAADSDGDGIEDALDDCPWASGTSTTDRDGCPDSDGDGVDDSIDDCPFAAGNSSVDRDGCPDRDGDGTSDINDGWTSSNPNFAVDVAVTQNYDFNDVDHSPGGN